QKNENDSVFFSKFYLFTREFKKWRNIVYLDSDILVRGSLEDLAKAKGFASTRDNTIFLLEQFILSDHEKKACDELRKGYRMEKDAFCSGMFAFSTDIIKEKTFDELKGLAERYGSVAKYREQSIINLYFCGKWHRLPDVFGILVTYIGKDLMMKDNVDGIILHFAGPKKPWDRDSRYYQEWKSSLDRADGIDISRPQKPARIWTWEEMLEQERLLKSRPRQILKNAFFRMKMKALECLNGRSG
ncbi:MAG: hypothetical protein NTY68_00605, partial [Candidatus Micrarchaeota archaeon]|nr:hypothetical protein [Candidatus Micrarchaeota archaeon]